VKIEVVELTFGCMVDSADAQYGAIMLLWGRRLSFGERRRMFGPLSEVGGVASALFLNLNLRRSFEEEET
jgi:hypothetical protein